MFGFDAVATAGDVVDAAGASAGIDPTTVQTMPTGLALIAGDQTATTPQPGEATGWTCGSTSAISESALVDRNAGIAGNHGR